MPGISTVKADFPFTVYVNADGSVNPPTAPMTTTDNFTYILNDNVGQVIVERDNVVIDGAFHAIGGLSMKNGLILSGRSKVTVENTQIWTSGEFVKGTYVAMPGIDISYSTGIRLIGNNFTDNVFAVNIANSNGTIVSGNNIFIDKTATLIDTSQWEGISMEYSSGNIISDNNITNCGIGIILRSSSGNSIYHNNFINNTQQVNSYNLTNTWDDGYRGNYWSDYPIKYPNATEIGSSGVWNTPYQIDTNNTDHYPLTTLNTVFPIGEWVRYVPDPSTVTFTYWQKDNTSYVNVTLGFLGFDGFNVTDWGTPTVNGNNITVNTEIWRWTGIVSDIYSPPTPHIYSLGNLSGGLQYSFVFKAWNTTVASWNFAVVPELPSFLILPLFMLATLLAATVYRKRHSI
jgi:parallel beta-helix repeat protein